MLQVYNLSTEEFCKLFCLIHSDQYSGKTVVCYGCMTLEMLLNLLESSRRVNRNRNGSCKQNSHESKKVFNPGREHNEDRIFGFKTQLLQPCSYNFCTFPQFK